jgi:ketopantoate reductase
VTGTSSSTSHRGGLRAGGAAFHSHEGKTIIGPCLDGRPLHLAERVSDGLNGAGFEAEATRDVKTTRRRKLVFGAA